MGYTHYWYQSKTGQRPLKPTTLKDIKSIISRYRSILCYEYTQPNKAPVVNSSMIRFNGKGDDGHETFVFEPYAKNPSWSAGDKKVFSFCKTARKPYDLPVCCILIAIKADLDKEIEVSSDGINRGEVEENWPKAAEIMRGMGYRVGFSGSELIADKAIKVTGHSRSGRRVRPHRRRNTHPPMGARRSYLAGENL
jgi:hypothetical protein